MPLPGEGYDNWEGDNTQLPIPQPRRDLWFPLPSPPSSPPPPPEPATPAPPSDSSPPPVAPPSFEPDQPPYDPSSEPPPEGARYDIPRPGEFPEGLWTIWHEGEPWIEDRPDGFSEPLEQYRIEDWQQLQSGFVARGRPRRSIEEEQLRMPRVGDPWPRVPTIPRRREPVRSRRFPDRMFGPEIPEPLPSERAPYPVMPPPRPPLEVPAPPSAPDLEQLPRVEIPPPVPTERPPTMPQETRSPAPPGVGIPPQPLPQPLPRPRAPRPQTARWPRIASPAVAAASILRRYITRRDEAEAQPRFNFRDSIPETAGLPVQPLPETARPPQPQLPNTVGELPAMPDLTPLNEPALPFAQPFAQPNRRTDECRCEDETEEEAEERRERNASNVVAEVKSYRRRMSQNSLDNLE